VCVCVCVTGMEDMHKEGSSQRFPRGFSRLAPRKRARWIELIFKESFRCHGNRPLCVRGIGRNTCVSSI
jgi:hypothetical protein